MHGEHRKGRVVVSAVVDTDMRDWLDRVAKESGEKKKKRSWIIENALKEYRKQHKTEIGGV